MKLDADRLAVLSGLAADNDKKTLNESADLKTLVESENDELQKLRDIIREEVEEVMSQLAAKRSERNFSDAVKNRSVSSAYGYDPTYDDAKSAGSPHNPNHPSAGLFTGVGFKSFHK
tara:strand:+ start:612 stop:962 length:351 start_codon:yes stop_codon:yes gene_type:complete